MASTTLRLRSDEHLVALFRAGREDAFETLHDRHRRRLCAVAARTLRSRGDAEGIVQEAFVRAHRVLRDADHAVELRPWLHRVVRNLCIDELRRARVATLPLQEHDRAGEDAYAALSRRHELRELIDGLADLPERQRSALLMRELDGLSHEQVAKTLEITPEASRRLVARARDGLVAARDAREAPHEEIRLLLLEAHDERRRPAEHALRHLRTCDACRAYRDEVKRTRGRLRALMPPIGIGPLAALLQAGAATKVAATVGAVAVLAGGGAVVAGSQRVITGHAPATVPGGQVLVGHPIRKGTPLPKTIALTTVQVRLGSDRVKRHVRVTCPPGMTGRGLTIPQLPSGRDGTRDLRVYQLSRVDMDRHRRTTSILYAAGSPATLRVGVVCKR